MKLGKRWLKNVEPSDDPATWVPCISEIPCGSKMKYALDKKTGQLSLHRALPQGLEYPTSYGFIAHSLGSDGMEMDMLILTAEPLLPLTLVRVRTIGGFTVESSDKGLEDKLIGVAIDDPSVDVMHELEQVPRDLRDRIEHFFKMHERDRGIDSHVSGWFGRTDAHPRLAKALELGRKKKT